MHIFHIKVFEYYHYLKIFNTQTALQSLSKKKCIISINAIKCKKLPTKLSKARPTMQ